MSNKRRDFLKQLCKDFGIDILYVFGSRAKQVRNWIAGKGEIISSASSDVDIGVRLLPGRRLRFKEKASLVMALEDFLGINKLNLVVIPEADPFLAANIIHGERLFFRNEYEADEYELYILRRAGNLPLLEKERPEFIFGKN